MTRRRLTGALLSLAALLAAGILLAGRRPAGQGPGKASIGNSQESPLPVTAVPLKRATHQSRGEVYGRVEGTPLKILPETEGTLQELRVKEGQRVEEGEILAVLLHPPLNREIRRQRLILGEAQQAIDAARAALHEGARQAEGRLLALKKYPLQAAQQRVRMTEIKRELRDKEALLSLDGVSREELHQLRQSLKEAQDEAALLEMGQRQAEIGFRPRDLRRAGRRVPEDPDALRRALIDLNTQPQTAALEGALSRLAREKETLNSLLETKAALTIRAPQRASVGVIHHHRGERVTRDKPLFTLMLEKPRWGVFAFPSAQGSLLREGLPLSLLPDKGVFPLEIILPLINPQSGTLTAKVRLPSDYLPGMFLRASYPQGPPREVQILPTEALLPLSSPGGNVREREDHREGICFLIQGRRIQKRTVILGDETDQGWVLKEGIPADALLVSHPSESLKTGQAVAPEKREKQKKEEL